MKKIKVLLCAAVVSALVFTGCSNDDDAPTNDLQIAGTYRLTEVNTDEPTDFNQDGTESANQMLESNCYNDSDITFNADGTFTYDVKDILVNETAGSFACDDYTVSGTWVLQGGVGSMALIDATFENPNGENVTLRFNKDGNELTQYSLISQYPDRDASGGAIYRIGSVELIFEKN